VGVPHPYFLSERGLNVLRKYSIFFPLVLFIIMGGCTPKASIKEGEPAAFISWPAMDAGLYEGPSVAVRQGKVFSTWYDLKRRLMLSSGSDAKEVSEGSPSPSLLSYNLIHSDGDALYFLWRPKIERGGAEKIGAKYLLFRASYDAGQTLAKPVVLNHGEGAMEPAVASNGKGDVYVVWNDERNGKFDIYLNVSHDRGRTWLGEEMRMDTDAPGSVQSVGQNVLASGDDVWVMWLDSEKGKRLLLRHSGDAGRTWGEPQELYRDANIYDPKFLKIDQRICIIFSVNLSKKYQYGAKGLYSDDFGKTWHPLGDMKVTSWMQFEINAASDSAGNIYMAFAERDKIKTGIDNIYFMKSPDKGQTWTEPVRLQTNTPHYTVANLPQIASDDSGRIAVVWVDYRNIRGNIYANLSKDYGRTWLKKEMFLSTLDRNSNLPRLVAGGEGSFYAIWLEYKNDKMEEGVVRVREVKD
jgi:hypothetical protein